ncbi:MAG TPA: helix-turn-helix domain-containing protein [Rhodopila sp.]|nr:helix-turn-helix domain-containing protein [Rhodopila sp.]
MEKVDALAALAVLGQEIRLDIDRLLVQAGPAGLPAGQFSDRLSLPSATLAFHLKELKNAKLALGHRVLGAGRQPARGAIWTMRRFRPDPSMLCRL